MKCIRIVLQEKKRKYLLQFLPNTANVRECFEEYKRRGILVSISRGVFVAPCVQKMVV